MSFWKSIFGKKEEEKKADFITANTPNPVVSHINAERKDNYYHSDKEILKLFYDNKERFAKTILPMIDLCQAIGFSRQELRIAILNSIKFLTNNGALEIFEKIMTENKIQRNKLFVELQKNFTNPYKFDALLWDTAFDETLLDAFVLNQDEVDEIATEKKETYKEDMVYSAYHKHMLTVAIVKTFLYTKVIALIEKEAELTQILNNAYKKYHDVGEITEKTYDIFFDYIKIPKQYFTTIDYCRCIFQMYCTPYSLYSVEDIQLENNIHNSNF